MSMTDPIADLLTRIRNAAMVSKSWVDIPCSKQKIRILYILKEENYIRDYVKIEDGKQDMLRAYLKYDFNNDSVIRGITRISTPGCRSYVSVDNLPRVLNGMGIAIIATSKGVMSNKKAKLLNVGGEVLCHVW
tara:strand:+ start:877 stop:1275 length:399 start_codon:yes stop_codon:yes gene_type:complete